MTRLVYRGGKNPGSPYRWGVILVCAMNSIGDEQVHQNSFSSVRYAVAWDFT